MKFTDMFKYDRVKTESQKKKEAELIEVRKRLKKKLEDQNEDIYIEDDWMSEFND